MVNVVGWQHDHCKTIVFQTHHQERFAKEVKRTTGWKCGSLSAAKHRLLGCELFLDNFIKFNVTCQS